MPPYPIGKEVENDLAIICGQLPKNSLTLEIGTFQGIGSSKIIASSSNVFRLYCVDPYFTPAPDYNAGRDYALIATTMKNLDSWGKKAIMIVAESIQIASMFADAALNLVFIDGNHTYSSVTRDIDLWWPKLKSGGWMCGDDMDDDEWDEAHLEEDFFDKRHNGVIKAVVERFAKNYQRSGVFWSVQR